MLAEHKSFTTCLTRFGFDAIHDLTKLPFLAINKMIQHLSRWKQRVADVEEVNNHALTLTFPYLTLRKFKALCSWAH